MEHESDIANDMSLCSIESTQSNLLSEVSVIGYGERLESEDSEIEEPEIFEPEIFEEPENPISEFPNEAYRDLMLLVTKHKLNNKAGNAIIRFLINIQLFRNHRYLKISKRGENS